jgi:hypothetical protein
MKRVGHQEIHGENIAQFEFSQAGWNPFKHYVDVDQVDLLLRRRTPPKPPEYREVQVKWCRSWVISESSWQGKFFTHVSWRHFTTEDFASHRPELFVAFVIPNAEQIYTGDIFIFCSGEFHELIQRSPAFTKGTNRKCFELCHGHDERWYLLLQRNKFEQLNADTAFEVTASRRRFGLLDEPKQKGESRVKPAEKLLKGKL